MMQIVRLMYPFHIHAPFSLQPSAMAIGYFDGVHTGHQAVIGEAIRCAKEAGLASSVMTFDPHPKQLFGRMDVADCLTPLPEKLRRFAQLGADIAYVVSFTKPFSQLSPERFVEECLAALDVQSVAVGFDFTFGCHGNATPLELWRLARGRFRVNVIPAINSGEEKISSTAIRQALRSGDIAKANRYLGRRYSICGKLSGCDHELLPDFPSLLPPPGKYLVTAKAASNQLTCILEIVQPPLGQKSARLRLHLHAADSPAFALNRLAAEPLDIHFFHAIAQTRSEPQAASPAAAQQASFRR